MLAQLYMTASNGAHDIEVSLGANISKHNMLKRGEEPQEIILDVLELRVTDGSHLSIVA